MNDDTILEPPGSIAILGTTALGIEAALYGRYLGYDVRLFAGIDSWQERDFLESSQHRIGPRFVDDWYVANWCRERPLVECWDDALPMMPDRCLSSLAQKALAAQAGDSVRALPTTMAQWIDQGLVALTQTDLLRDRVHSETFVKAVDQIPVESDDEDGDSSDESISPDFGLALDGNTDVDGSEDGVFCCEAIVVADIPLDAVQINFARTEDYWFEFANLGSGGAEEQFYVGLQQIASIYAKLAGREDLDLYRPERL